ncbi:MAG: diguanylate cyclase [Brevinematales bacterium]|nr:diguanylate cyclase [Brevinematales bacterium]
MEHIKKLLDLNKDVFIQTDSPKKATKNVIEKLQDYVILKQTTYPLSPFSTFLKTNFDEKVFQKISKKYSLDIVEYFLKLIQEREVDVMEFFEEYFEIVEFSIKRNELYNLIAEFFIKLILKSNVKNLVIHVTCSEIFTSSSHILKVFLKTPKRPRLVLIEDISDTESVSGNMGVEKHILLFSSKHRKPRKVLSNKNMFLEHYRWMCWEVCVLLYSIDEKLRNNKSIKLKAVISMVGNNSIDDAIDDFYSMLENLKDNENMVTLSRLNRLLASLYSISQSRWKLAINAARKSYEFALRSGDEREIILSKSLMFFVGLMDSNELFELFNYLRENKQLFKKLYNYITNFYYFYIVIRNKIELEEILKIAKATEEDLIRSNDKFKLVLHYHLLANVMVEFGNFEEAIKYDLKALRTAREVNSPNISHIYNSLSHIYYTTDKFDKALYFSKLSLKESISKIDIKEVCMSLVNIAYVYIITNYFNYANEVIETLMSLIQRANISKLPIHSNTKLWVMDMYVKRQLSGISSLFSKLLSMRDEEIEYLDTEGKAFYHWGLSMIKESPRAKIYHLRQALDYITKNEFKYIEAKIIRDLIYQLENNRDSNGFLDNIRNFIAMRKLQHPLYEDILFKNVPVVKLGKIRIPGDILIQQAQHQYQITSLQSKKNELRFLNKVQEVLIRENQENVLVNRIVRLIKNSFLVEKVIFFDREKNLLISMPDISDIEKYYIENIKISDIEYPDDSLPYKYNKIIPIIFSNGETKGFLILASNDPSYFIEEEQIGTVKISALLLSNKLEIIKSQNKLEKLAKIDFLTGIPNRVEIDNFIVRELERCSRVSNYCFSLAIIDLDNFKFYNDTFGHIIGDVILREFAKKLSRVVRKVDFVGRFGGDEFVVIMPYTDRTKALLAAKRWFRVFENSFWEEVILDYGNNKIEIPEDKKLSMSVGVSDIIEANYDIERLFSIADKRLYMSKKSKNKVN